MAKQEDLKFWIPNKAVIDIDTEGLIGSKLTVTNLNGDTRQCVIAGCDPYIGLSIVREDDPKVVIYCLHGPFDPHFREDYLKKEHLKVEYNRRFPVGISYCLTAMKTGKLDMVNMFKDQDADTGFSNGVGCPYGI